MELAPLDIGILTAYLLATLVIGFWLAKRASANLNSYFLGGNNIPWYFLGLSNASGMFDISGTMWMVYLLFIYGLKSVWIPWLWPVFNQIFLMAYLSVWLRRSQVMTGAEWIRFRFGSGKGAELSHLVVVVFALINVIGFLAYGFIGIGKFASIFLPWQLHPDPELNNQYYGLIITGITTLYVVKGGMFSVVFTEVLQFFVMTVACIAVGVIAMVKVAPEQLAAVIPAGWENLFFGWKLDLDWSGLLESANAKIESDGWTLFGAFFMMMLFKGVLQSMAGPAPNYDMQRVLSTRTPREAAKMSGFVNLVLLFPRYMLITGLTVLALVFYREELAAMGDKVDFELVLPFAMRNFVPTGLLGLLIAGLLAAFMSTFAATLNAAPAYLVNDIYKRYLRPEASSRHLVNMSYLASVAVVLIGTAVGLYIHSLNDIIQWIVAALFGGYTAANVLKWHWWRFNGYGYFWGMASGIAAAMAAPSIFPDLTTIYTFPIILAVSLTGSIAGSLAFPPDEMETLKMFYLKVRPWGFWKPVRQALLEDGKAVAPNRGFKRDAANVGIGLVWQTSLTAAPIFLVTKMFVPFAAALGLSIAAMIFLKFNWYDRIEDWPADLNTSEKPVG